MFNCSVITVNVIGLLKSSFSAPLAAQSKRKRLVAREGIRSLSKFYYHTIPRFHYTAFPHLFTFYWFLIVNYITATTI